MIEFRDGFYYSINESHLPMPIPQDFKINEDLITKLKIIIHKLNLQSYENAHCIEYLGFSKCRICNIDNGCKEYKLIYNNDMYILPEGFIHYIESHNVHPTEKIINLLKNIDDVFFKNELNDSKTGFIEFDDNLKKFRYRNPQENFLRLINGLCGLSFSN